MIGFLFKNWRWLASFLGMAAFLGWTAWQSHEISRLRQELLSAQTSAASYEESLSVLRTDAAAKITALESERDRQIARTKNMERLLGRIEGASDDKDGPVAPVLRDTFERLYGNAENPSQSN